MEDIKNISLEKHIDDLRESIKNAINLNDIVKSLVLTNKLESIFERIEKDKTQKYGAT